MAQDEELSRKERKAQRDAERQRKGKKRKREEVDAPEDQNELQQDFIPLDVATNEEQAPRKKKSKKKDAQVVEIHDNGLVVNGASDTPAPKPKKRKKEKKEKHSTAENSEQKDEAVISDKSKAPRFILFIGNLPYATTDASLHAHFKKLAPFTLRHRTDPKTKKSKGFAFLEFENYDRMKTCLKLYHHSLFDPAKAEGAPETAVTETDEKKRKAKGARKINVELTAGGGGKAEGRKEKIKAKNVRLGEQRKRRAELEAKESEKAKRKEKKSSGGNAEPVAPEKAESVAVDDVRVDTGDMHPSRVARMKK